MAETGPFKPPCSAADRSYAQAALIFGTPEEKAAAKRLLVRYSEWCRFESADFNEPAAVCPAARDVVGLSRAKKPRAKRHQKILRAVGR